MSNATLDRLDSQRAFEDFVLALAQAAVSLGAAPVREQACAAAERALGGGARAAAAVRSLAVALAYMDAQLPEDASILDEEDLATVAAHRMVLPVQTMRLQDRIAAAEATPDASSCPVQSCDGKAHSRGRAQRTMVGRHGKMTVRLRQSECQKPGCGRRFSPACELLGLDGGGSRRAAPR